MAIKRKISRFEVDLITEEVETVDKEEIHTIAFHPRLIDFVLDKGMSKEDFEALKPVILAKILSPKESVVSARSRKVKEFEEII